MFNLILYRIRKLMWFDKSNVTVGSYQDMRERNCRSLDWRKRESSWQSLAVVHPWSQFAIKAMDLRFDENDGSLLQRAHCFPMCSGSFGVLVTLVTFSGVKGWIKRPSSWWGIEWTHPSAAYWSPISKPGMELSTFFQTRLPFNAIAMDRSTPALAVGQHAA